jgi:putative transposase
VLKSDNPDPQTFTFKATDKTTTEKEISNVWTYKLRLRPTKEQKEKLNQWAGCVRFLYNKTIKHLTNKKQKKYVKSTVKRRKNKKISLTKRYNVLNENQLRYRFTTVKGQKTQKDNSFFNNKPWLKECPVAVRKGAVYQAIENLQSCYTNLKEQNINHFDAPYRTKKREVQSGYSYSLEKNNIEKRGDKLFIFQKSLGEMRYYGTKQLHKLIQSNRPELDCKIQKSAYGEYFLIIHRTIKPKVQKNEFTKPVSIDPGVRKFLTTYSMNESYMIGNRWTNTIMPVLLELDKEKDPKKQKLLRKRVFYLKKEMHDQAASFIARNYDLVLMAKLDIKRLSSKTTRRLRTKTVRAMLNAGHAKFFQRLKEKCFQHGSKFLHVTEEYTSQTCPCCGRLSKCGEVYRCRHCGFNKDRDMVGALNILLKAVRP